ncbi:MAG: hypothetical protein IJ104_00835 [Methanobrevibacter sp.]|nr:hypothetical protein [Methanobrevibacter sp.]MBQ9024915.1 hypothetical protein [Methanobrevibacter sp.]
MNSNIIVWVTPGNEIRPGDEITTTTSEFNYDCLTGSFDKEATIPVEVIAEHIAEDYSEYVAEKSTNGGCYGYDYWKVIEVIHGKDIDDLIEVEE